VTEGGPLTDGIETFVGRGAELELVSYALQAARASSPQIVVVVGEPGIGKTAFLRRCLAQAGDLVLLEASGDESEARLEFGIVSQLVSHAPEASSPSALSRRLGTGPAPSTFAIGAELLALLGSLQDLGPVVVALDDAQWIDAASASALLFAMRRLYADRVGVLVATRPDGLGPDGSGWSRMLNDAERVQRVTLPGLDGREVSQLAGALGHANVTAAGAERLREHTGGHPLYLRSLLRELPPETLASEHGPLPAPHSFAATVLAQLTSVKPEVQDLVAAAAVAGHRCSVELAGAAAGASDPIGALDDALTADLLTVVRAQVPTEVSFPHPLVRAAVYDDLSLKRRRQLHLACAGLTTGSASLAHRVAASSGADDELAAELAEAGQREVAGGMLRAGIEHLLLASRVGSSRRLRETALLDAVDYLGIAGDVPRAQVLREAVAACSDSARRSLSLAALTASAGHLPESIAALTEVAQRPDLAEQPELLGRATSSLAIVCAYAGRGSEAIVWARRALDGERPARTVEVTARQALALGLMVSGRAPEGVAVLDSLSASRIAPEPFEAELLATRGGLKVWCGDLRGAVEDLSAVIGWSRAGAVARSLPNAYSSLADAEYSLGRWDEGHAHADLAVSLAHDLDQVWELAFAHAMAARFQSGRGDWRTAAEHVAAARHTADAAPLPISLYHASMASANLAAARGHWKEVLDSLDELRANLTEGVAATAAQRTWGLEGEALIQTGRLDEASGLLDRVAGDPGPSSDVDTVDLWRLRGALEQARDHPEAAREAFEQGQAVARGVKSPLAEGALELAFGHLLRKTGRRGAATARLQVARGLFERLQARPLIERCEAELAACGVRSATGDGHGDQYGLSARERAVATLVVSGKSNREVGEELYLSTKAIEYHLSNIFTKVGVSSRHQLASRLPPTASD
jgi:DNA-binding CsgD family transcriptional regulator